MRSSNKRSRSKPNRNRPSGNIVNRVFDSSGPEGKVRGTPQQIIDKYNQLARDAQLSNDRVAAENFQQHAEHYLRMLSEAQREMDAKREQQDQQNRDRQQDQQNRDRQQQSRRDQQNAQDEPQQQQQPAAQPQGDNGDAPTGEAKQVDTKATDVIDVSTEAGDSGLVETPESKPAPRRRARRKPKEAETEDQAKPAAGGDQPEAAE